MSQPPPGYPQGQPSGLPNAPTQHLPAAGGPPPHQPPHQQPHLQGPPPPLQGPHPGYYGPQGPGGPPAPPRSKAASAVGILALVSLAATVIGLSVDENGRNAWDTVHAWGGLAILGALLTSAPVLRSSLNLRAQRAWQIAACGAGALALFWVLFVLPAAGSNTSLVITVGAAAGIIAAWVAPGRDDAATPPGPGW